MYIDEEIDVSEACNYNEILERIEEKYKGDEHLYRFTLTGGCDFSFDIEVLKEKLPAFGMTIKDKTAKSADLEKLSLDFSLKGLFAKFAIEDKEEMSEEEFNEAVKAGLYFIEKEENNEN